MKFQTHVEYNHMYMWIFFSRFFRNLKTDFFFLISFRKWLHGAELQNEFPVKCGNIRLLQLNRYINRLTILGELGTFYYTRTSHSSFPSTTAIHSIYSRRLLICKPQTDQNPLSCMNTIFLQQVCYKIIVQTPTLLALQISIFETIVANSQATKII